MARKTIRVIATHLTMSFSWILRPLATASAIAVAALGVASRKYEKARLYWHLGLYVGTLGLLSVWGVVVSVLATAAGQVSFSEPGRTSEAGDGERVGLESGSLLKREESSGLDSHRRAGVIWAADERGSWTCVKAKLSPCTGSHRRDSSCPGVLPSRELRSHTRGRIPKHGTDTVFAVASSPR